MRGLGSWRQTGMQKNRSKNTQQSAPKTHSESHEEGPKEPFNHNGAKFGS